MSGILFSFLYISLACVAAAKCMQGNIKITSISGEIPHYGSWINHHHLLECGIKCSDAAQMSLKYVWARVSTGYRWHT